MRVQMKDCPACVTTAKRSQAKIQLRKHQRLSEYELSQTSYSIQSQRTGKTEVPHDFEAKVHSFQEVYLHKHHQYVKGKHALLSI